MARGNPRITVRLTPATIDRLRRVAEATGQTVGDIVRDATMAALAEYDVDLGLDPQIDGQQTMDDLCE